MLYGLIFESLKLQGDGPAPAKPRNLKQCQGNRSDWATGGLAGELTIGHIMLDPNLWA